MAYGLLILYILTLLLIGEAFDEYAIPGLEYDIEDERDIRHYHTKSLNDHNNNNTSFKVFMVDDGDSEDTSKAMTKVYIAPFEPITSSRSKSKLTTTTKEAITGEKSKMTTSTKEAITYEKSKLMTTTTKETSSRKKSKLKKGAKSNSNLSLTTKTVHKRYTRSTMVYNPMKEVLQGISDLQVPWFFPNDVRQTLLKRMNPLPMNETELAKYDIKSYDMN